MKIPPALLSALSFAALAVPAPARADAVVSAVAPVAASLNGKPAPQAGVVIDKVAAEETCPKPDTAEETCPKPAQTTATDSPLLPVHVDNCPGCGLG